jgi:dolichyl-phosphate beta-glucosyltransferase
MPQTIYPSKISIVIPCFNEETRIRKSVEYLAKFNQSTKNLFASEHIFVLDGCTDHTENVIFNSIRELYNNNIIINNRLMSYYVNRGKGHAVWLGLQSAASKNIVILDADLSIPPEYLLESFKKFPFNGKEPFIIIGNRVQAKPQPIYRIIAGKAFKALVWLLTGIYTDTQAPYKILHNAPKELFDAMTIDGFAYDVELILLARKFGLKEYYQKVLYFNDERSHVTLKKALKMFFEIIRIKKRKKLTAS